MGGPSRVPLRGRAARRGGWVTVFNSHTLPRPPRSGRGQALPHAGGEQKSLWFPSVFAGGLPGAAEKV